MDPVTAALVTAGKWMDLQIALFQALPDASKTVRAEQLFEEGQFVRNLIEEAAAHVGLRPLGRPAAAVLPSSSAPPAS